MMRMNERSQTVKITRALWRVLTVKETVVLQQMQNLWGKKPASTVILFRHIWKVTKRFCKMIQCKLYDNNLDYNYHKPISYVYVNM